MPSFDLVIPDSFLFIPANFSFISFCIFVSFVMSKIFKSTIMFFFILITLLSIAYYDLFVKLIIKNYYEITQMDSRIYTSANKNKDNKIKSLSLVEIYSYPLKYSTTLSSTEVRQIAKIHENYVEEFIDISTYAYKFNKTIHAEERVYLNSYKYIKPEDNKKEMANFKITKKLKDNILSKYIEYDEFRFWDNKSNTVIATAFKISFLKSKNNFRNKYLYWTEEKESEFSPSPIQNFDNIYKKLFIDIK